MEMFKAFADTKVGLFALKAIPDGSELTFNYQFETLGEIKKKCMCGVDNCLGFIGEKPQTKDMEKKIVKKKKSKAAPVKLRLVSLSLQLHVYYCWYNILGMPRCGKMPATGVQSEAPCCSVRAVPQGVPPPVCGEGGHAQGQVGQSLAQLCGVWHPRHSYCKTHEELGALCGDHLEEV